MREKIDEILSNGYCRGSNLKITHKSMRESYKNTLGNQDRVPAVNNWTRRTFLRTTGSASAAVLGVQLIPWQCAKADGITSALFTLQWKNNSGTWETLGNAGLGGEQQTVIGKKVEFQVIDNSTGATIADSITWTLGGNYFTDYNPHADGTNFVHGYRPTEDGKPLPTANPLAPVYWADPASSGQSVKAEWGSYSLEGSLIVLAPTAAFSADRGVANSCADTTEGQAALLLGGTTGHGIVFHATVSDADLPTELKGGEFCLCQTVDWDRELHWHWGTTFNSVALGRYKAITTTPSGVDWADDGIILDYDFPYDGIQPVGPTQYDGWFDSPGAVLSELNGVVALGQFPDYYRNHDVFNTYLMYKNSPSNSAHDLACWVPVKKITWEFSTAVTKVSNTEDQPQGEWAAILGAADPTTAATLTSTDCSDHPRFTKKADGSTQFYKVPNK